MNRWNNNSEKIFSLQREDNNVFRLKVRLDQGDYEYKFIVDGKWTPDHAEILNTQFQRYYQKLIQMVFTTFYYNGNDSTNKVSL